MIALQTILCPVDFSPASPRQVDLAAELARTFGARLVLHHNRHSLGTGASVGWMWRADHKGDGIETIEQRLVELTARLPEGLEAETLMTEGPLSRAVVAVAEAIDADLVVLTAHGELADDHVSITEQMLERCSRPVLVLHEPTVETRVPRFFTAAPADRDILVVPTDLMPESQAAISLALDLARSMPIEVHLLHVIPEGMFARSVDKTSREAMEALDRLIPSDLKDRVQAEIVVGDPAEGILRAADMLGAACIVMGEHTRTPLRRWFSRDTSRAILHQARCPIWFVPGTHAA